MRQSTALVLGLAAAAALAVPPAAAAVTPVDLDAVTTWRFNGDPADQATGYETSHAGDVNGDGLQDVLVSSVSSPLGRSFAGTVYVVFGRRGEGGVVDLADLGDDGFRLFGGTELGLAGIGTAGVGDVNGDGLDDVIVTERDTPRPDGVKAGAFFVVYGKTTTEDVDLAVLGDGGFRVTGPVGAEGGNVTSLDATGAGDFDGDGFRDMAVSTGENRTDGTHFATTFVVYGAATNRDVDLSDPRAPVLRILGDTRDNLCGRDLDDVGDINGDGRPDLGIACAKGDLVVTGRATTAYVVFGRRTRGRINLAVGGRGTHLKVIGRRLNDDFSAITGLGDVNGDRREDFALGSPASNFNGVSSSAGAIFVVFGRPGTTAVNYNSPTSARRGYRIDGEAPSGLLGGALTGPGDVTGDGRADLLAGSLTAGGSESNGLVWQLPGKAGIRPVDVAAYPGAVRLDSPEGDGRTEVDAIGDFDGDGRPDAIIGSSGFTAPGFPAVGHVHIVALPFGG